MSLVKPYMYIETYLKCHDTHSPGINQEVAEMCDYHLVFPTGIEINETAS